ncbi:MAG: hypothetical protein SGCHY_005416 [Lobulomycetales sp.]
MGVKLAWLIDPKNKIMRVYTKNASDPAGYSCSEDLSWRDLDGGSVLPGFKVSSFSLDAVMNPESGSSEEDEQLVTCPYCPLQFTTLGPLLQHLESHREANKKQKMQARYVA